MKKIGLIILALILGSGIASAQRSDVVPQVDPFIPRTLSAGTQMSARGDTVGLDDTTRAFISRGYSAIYVGVEGAGNDSTYAYVSYQISKDGTTFGALTLIDSVKQTGVVGEAKYIPLPANALGAYQTRVRVYGTTWGVYGKPKATITTKIIRVLPGAIKTK